MVVLIDNPNSPRLWLLQGDFDLWINHILRIGFQRRAANAPLSMPGRNAISVAPGGHHQAHFALLVSRSRGRGVIDGHLDAAGRLATTRHSDADLPRGTQLDSQRLIADRSRLSRGD